jgi:four helix bundle protein
MQFNLEQRTTDFAKRVIRMCKVLPRDAINARLTSQVVGSAGSIGANYREANDALSKKDFLMRMKIARREAKECIHWLELISEANDQFKKRMTLLHQEAHEIRNILSSIILKKT